MKLFPANLHYDVKQFTVAALFDVIILAEGRNSVEQKAIVPGHYCYIVPAWLTNEMPRIYHVMH